MKTPLVLERKLSADEEAFLAYRSTNPHIFKNKVISYFFEQKQHIQLFGKLLTEPSIEINDELEQAFRRFYFNIRFTKYLSSLVHYADIDFHRACRRKAVRNPLIFDRRRDEEGEMGYGELLISLSSQSETEENGKVYSDPVAFQSSIENPNLFSAFTALTQKQKVVITLAYAAGIMDTDIACAMKVTQQAITKTRITALRKMKGSLMSQNESICSRKGIC